MLAEHLAFLTTEFVALYEESKALFRQELDARMQGGGRR